MRGKKSFTISRHFIIFTVLVIWAPLSVNDFPDTTTNIRFLLSLPLLILSFNFIQKKFLWMCTLFTESMIVRKEDKETFIKSTLFGKRLTQISRYDFLPLILVFIFSSFEFMKKNEISSWEWRHENIFSTYWFYFVSLPLYQFFFLKFFIFLLSLWRFFFRLSHMNLDLRPSDPDAMGGLRFLSQFLNSFLFSILAISSAAAAGAAQMIIQDNLDIQGLKIIFVVFAVILMMLLTGPYFLFFKVMIRAKIEGLHLFNVLSSRQQRDFEDFWFNKAPLENDSLKSESFSALADFSTVYDRALSMKPLPLRIHDLIPLAFALFVPFLPVLALEMPWKLIFSQTLKMIR